MNFYGKVFSFFLFCQILFLSIAQGQVNDCGFEIIGSEVIVNSDNDITFIIDVRTNNIQANGVAYLINNSYLQSLGLNIFWSSASFSVHSNDETFQVAISGTSTSVITLPDELELSGRIAFSFNEEPLILNDIKTVEEDSVLADIVDLTVNEDDIAILDSSILVTDTVIILIDTVTTVIDTLIAEIDSFNIINDSISIETEALPVINNTDVEYEDSLLYIFNTFTGDSILNGYELILLEDLPNLCEINYVCQLPISNETQTVENEARMLSEQIVKAKNNDLDTSFGSVFDNDLFKLEELSFTVFPNPAVEYFYIHPNKINENSKVIVYATNGKIVLEKNLSKTNYSKVNTQNLPKGLYFVLLKSNREVSHLTKLIIK